MFEFHWLQKQQHVKENRKYIENTQLHEEHGGLLSLKQQKSKWKKMKQNLRKHWLRKSEATRLSGILPAVCMVIDLLF